MKYKLTVDEQSYTKNIQFARNILYGIGQPETGILCLMVVCVPSFNKVCFAT